MGRRRKVEGEWSTLTSTNWPGCMAGNGASWVSLSNTCFTLKRSTALTRRSRQYFFISNLYGIYIQERMRRAPTVFAIGWAGSYLSNAKIVEIEDNTKQAGVFLQSKSRLPHLEIVQSAVWKTLTCGTWWVKGFPPYTIIGCGRLQHCFAWRNEEQPTLYNNGQQGGQK